MSEPSESPNNPIVQNAVERLAGRDWQRVNAPRVPLPPAPPAEVEAALRQWMFESVRRDGVVVASEQFADLLATVTALVERARWNVTPPRGSLPIPPAPPAEVEAALEAWIVRTQCRPSEKRYGRWLWVTDGRQADLLATVTALVDAAVRQARANHLESNTLAVEPPTGPAITTTPEGAER